jgi:exopolysaccharide production protein ExoZ
MKYQWSAPVLTVGWTLDYEFIFYTLCALSLLVFSDVKRAAILITVALFTGTMILDFVLFPEKKYGHFMEFWYGIVIYFLIEKLLSTNAFKSSISTPPIKSKVLLSLIGLAFLISSLSIFMLDENGKAYLRFLTFGLPAALLVFLSILYEKMFGLKKFKLLELLGASSYSIYLSHEITLFLYYRLMGSAKNSSLLVDLSGVFIAIIVGVMLYRLIEMPMNNKAHNFIKFLSKR